MTETIELRKALGIGDSNIVARYFPTLEQAVQAYQEMRATQSSNNGSQVT